MTNLALEVEDLSCWFYEEMLLRLLASRGPNNLKESMNMRDTFQGTKTDFSLDA